MAVGLAVTACVGLLFSQQPALLKVIYGSKFGYIAIILGMTMLAFAVRGAAMNISAAAGTGLFLLYAALMGALISGIFIIYPWQTLVSAFFLTGGVFAVMSIYGYVTKKDLTSIGSFMIMTVIGLFIASLINVFLRNDLMGWIITYGILIAFVLLTAYDTQKLKEIAYATDGDPALASRLAIVGSLNLYVDFINIFLSLLRILGRKE
jgi:FtsH-binding integral membrane protein